MPVSDNARQHPAPGQHLLFFRGDIVRFRLVVEHPGPGTAWLRTNIGRARVMRREIIAAVDENDPPMHHDWFDIPMAETGNGSFELAVPLFEVGHFEGKCCFLPDGGQPLWPPGDNTHINVEPAESICANTVYNAFVRQFGPNKRRRQAPPADIDFPVFDAAGYTLIPPSGTFRGFIKELDFIVDELGCRYIQLLPVNPTPTTYGRMGRFGSPYASQSFRLVDAALAEFDRKATPMDQFIELVDAIHSRRAKVILDIAINHTGWAARLHEMYPRWLKRDEEGKIEVPGAWGVIWEDLAKLDYSRKGLWRFMARVFLTWCRRGVDGFRCDAGYMIPARAWQYIVARVREEYPDTVFFLEGLGGKISVTRDLLNTANLNWAYSELFQNYDRPQIHRYLPEAINISRTHGVMVNFAETHDNPRLAAVSTTYARMRTALCALFSSNGGFAFTNGVEWFATEKIEVHDANPLNWGAEVNQVDHIRRLSAILKTHPAFFDGVAQAFIEAGEGPYLALLRTPAPAASANRLLILVNLDCENPVAARWNGKFPGEGQGEVVDLISMQKPVIEKDQGNNRVLLSPGEVLCLSCEETDVTRIEEAEAGRLRTPPKVAVQRLKAKVLDIWQYFYDTAHTGDLDPEAEAKRLRFDPAAYCRSYRRKGEQPGVIVWQFPADLRREVMVPPGHFLMISAPVHFEARLVETGRVVGVEKGIEKDGGGCFALFSPAPLTDTHRPMSLQLILYPDEHGKNAEYGQKNAYVLYLQDPRKARVNTVYSREELMDTPLTLLETNGIGGMCRASSWWGHLESKYDALLAANMNPAVPDNRWIMFTRCRGWVVYQDYSQAIRTECIRWVSRGEKGVMKWRCRVPTGLGCHVRVSISIETVSGENRIRIYFYRHHQAGSDQLDDDRPVRLILRPDIEDRSFHEVTKAYTGPETVFPQSVFPAADGFVFQPAAGRRLSLRMQGAGFVREHEWTYMVHRPLEASRGMDPDSDLFSPGYFHGTLRGGETLVLDAAAGAADGKTGDLPVRRGREISRMETAASVPFPEAMLRAMDHFVVARRALKSVIAGYPWFLDWGRDSLIFCRGLIEAGKTETAMEILKLFGQFEQNGTLPNMISGEDATNRDTSDAPLWFLVACRDYFHKTGSAAFLDEPMGRRTLREIMFSIAAGYGEGTPGGVKMDPETGLVFSPSHFTWMDTNFPASTPRQGYPVEIQALWYASLRFLATISAPKGFAPPGGIPLEERAALVAAAMEKYFYHPEKGFLSDCLHCAPGCPPGIASPDDALRPNQLFAVTMGAVRGRALCENILSSCGELLVPGGIRSLADRPVDYPLEIRHNKMVLGEPHRPYRGRYQGDEDTLRKPAYHNGTAWMWVYPSFCEAWGLIYGTAGKRTALAWLSAATRLIHDGCPGHVPEIADGDYPHVQRGCDAQAWSASELYRVWSLFHQAL